MSIQKVKTIDFFLEIYNDFLFQDNYCVGLFETRNIKVDFTSQQIILKY